MHCNNCGAEIKDTQKFCPMCGTKTIVDSENKTKHISTKKKSRKTQAIIACACCLAIIIVGTIGGLNWNKRSNIQLNDADKNYVYFDSNFSSIKITDANSALEAISEIKEELGLNDIEKELKLESENNIDDFQYYRFQQYYKDIPVYGKSINISVKADGCVLALTSNCFAFNHDLLTEAKVAPLDIEKSLRKHFDNQDITVELLDNSKLVYYITDNDRPFLAYELRNTVTGTIVFVDADRGELLHCESVLSEVAAEISDKNREVIAYGWQNDNGSYHLYNDDYKVSVFDLNGIDTVINSEGSVYDDFRDYNRDTIYSKNSVFKKEEVLALKKVCEASQFYKNLGNNGFERIHVAINDNYDSGSNARGGATRLGDSFGAVMLFGTNFIYDENDVIGHEYTHAITSSIVNWNSDSIQTKALKEGYSDIMGVLFENANKPDWLIIHLSSILRDIIKPRENGHYQNIEDIKSNDENFYHHSTIISHAAYLMWNGNNDGDIFKIDSDKLAKLWYRSLFLLQSDATFNQCANSVVLTAKSMQNTGELTEAQVACVRRSFEAVGIYPNHLSKSTTNGAAVHIKDLYDNSLSSYYLKVEDEKSNVLVDSEFTDSEPYVVNVSNNGLYTFTVKQSKESIVEYVTEVRILNIERENSELNLQTALDFGDIETNSETLEKQFGNVVSYNNCLYYWKYNSDSFSKEEADFATYGYNENAKNQLVCRTSDGKESVVLIESGFSEIATANERIYYQVAKNSYYTTIKSCSLKGDDIKDFGDGSLCGVINDGKYVVFNTEYPLGVYSVDTVNNKKITVSNDDYLICADDSIICTQLNQVEKLSEQEISIYKINGDGSGKVELYLNKANELDSIKSMNEHGYFEEGFLDISLPYIKDNSLYFIFQHIAGSGHVTQSCKSVKINLDTMASTELKITYSEDSGAIQESTVNDTDYQKYISKYYNEKVLNESDYADFSNMTLCEYGAEGSGALIPEYCEAIGNKSYVLLTYGDFVSWNGWRQTYQFKKCALYEKDLSSGKINKLYETSISNQDDKDSIYSAYLQQLNKAYEQVKKDSKNDSTTMEFNPSYILYDIDKNGVKELIIKTGICEADYTFEFYTYKNGLEYLGSAHAGHSGLYIPEDDNGLYLRYCPPPGDICYVSLYRLTINENQINQETLYKDKGMSIDERDSFSKQYEYLDVDETHATDLSLLDEL